MAQGLPELGPNDLLLPAKGIVITPSNINYWRSTRRPDQRYTYAQLQRMQEWGIDHETVEDVVVRQHANRSEHCWGAYDPTPTYLLPCPILERRGDGSQCHVITPYGTKAWVYSNGSITKARQVGFKGPRNFAGPRR